MRKLVVNEKYNNKKLNTFILDNFSNLKSSTLFKALRKKDIRFRIRYLFCNRYLYESTCIKKNKFFKEIYARLF